MSTIPEKYQEQEVEGLGETQVGRYESANGYDWLVTFVGDDKVQALPVVSVVVTNSRFGTEWYDKYVGDVETEFDVVRYRDDEWVLAEDYMSRGPWLHIDAEHAEIV